MTARQPDAEYLALGVSSCIATVTPKSTKAIPTIRMRKVPSLLKARFYSNGGFSKCESVDKGELPITSKMHLVLWIASNTSLCWRVLFMLPRMRAQHMHLIVHEGCVINMCNVTSYLTPQT